MTRVFQPVGDVLLCEKVAREITTASGIVIPDVGEKDVTEARVLKGNHSIFKPGTVVVFAKAYISIGGYPMPSAVEITLDGKKFLVVAEAAILGVITEVET